MIRASVTGTFDAAGMRSMIDELATRSVTAGARVGGEAARVLAAQRRKSGRMAAIVVEPARRVDVGVAAAFHSPAYHAWYQSVGTLGNRKGKLRGAPRTARKRGPGTGVKPLNFLHAGLDAGRAEMLRVARGGR